MDTIKSYLPLAGSGAAVLAALLTILLALLRRVRTYRARVLLSAVRRVARHPQSFLWEVDIPSREPALQFGLVVAAELLLQLDGSRLTPADAIAEALASRHSRSECCALPWGADPTGALLQRASLAHATSLMARVLYPEDTAAFRQLLEDAGVLLSAVGRCKPISRDRSRPIGGQDERRFADFVQSFAGALVLVDAVDSRSGFAERVHVWHSRAYRGVTPQRAGRPNGQRRTRLDRAERMDRYDDTHRTGYGCEAWKRQMSGGTARDPQRPGRLVGDFDQRLLHLRGVTLCEDVRDGYLAFVLETSETCYAATEDPGPGYWTGTAEQASDVIASAAHHVGCKNVLASDGRCKGDPLFRRYEDGSIRRRFPDSGRLSLLTAYVTIVSSDSPPMLLLARRTGRVRHGQNVLSASAGGVMDPGPPGPAGDVTSLGQPDPLATVIRECREELGVSLDTERCRPIAVFLANIRGHDAELQFQGQLGAVVLYVALADMTFHELSVASRRADPARGRFEQNGLAACPLDSALTLARWTCEHATDLDQHGILSCLYASAALFGSNETRQAFTDTYQSTPWWTMSPYENGHDRLVRRQIERLINGPFPSTSG
jgi:8-oxo-dGTP pyrophosphatase MutT (NUDIX family)